MYDHDDEMPYMRIHPPRCIGSFASKEHSKLHDIIQKAYGENTTAWSILCSCGNDIFNLSIPKSASLVEAACSCGKKLVLFNPLEHGYDGELHNKKGHELDVSHSYKCAQCGHTLFKVAAGFQYSGETDVLEDKSIKIQPEDLFGWFVLAVECCKCEKSEIVFDIECA